MIVEASARGREVESWCSATPTRETSLPGEIVAHADWYDFEAKYRDGGMELVVPAPIADDQRSPGPGPGRHVFGFCGCSGLARCDFFVELDGEVLVNELNTIPGFTETSVYSKLLRGSGLPYPDLSTAWSTLRRALPREVYEF